MRAGRLVTMLTIPRWDGPARLPSYTSSEGEQMSVKTRFLLGLAILITLFGIVMLHGVFHRYESAEVGTAGLFVGVVDRWTGDACVMGAAELQVCTRRSEAKWDVGP